jgi:hypothetical protein
MSELEWTDKQIAKLERRKPVAKYDVELIKKAVAEAIADSQKFATYDDGGTCNFDACVVYVPGMRESTAKSIANVSMMNTRWHGRHLHLHGTEGQGARRTKMAEAQRDFLKTNYPQLNIGMYYQMD